MSAASRLIVETAASKGQHGVADAADPGTELNEAQCKEIAFNERKLQLAKVEACSYFACAAYLAYTVASVVPALHVAQR